MKTSKNKGLFLKPNQKKHSDKVFELLKSTTKEPDWQSVAEKLAEALEEAKQFLNYVQAPATPAMRIRMEIESLIQKMKQ